MDDKQAASPTEVGEPTELAMITAMLQRIAEALEALARAGQPEELNLVKPLSEYAGFDWSSIGASIVGQDRDGPTHLEYNGFVWTRRSPQNKFSPAIWYSRASGKDSEGNNHYLKLITFRTLTEAESMPEKISKAIHSQAPKVKDGDMVTGDHLPAEKSPGPESLPEQSSSSSQAASAGEKAGEKIPSVVGSNKYYSDALGKRWNIGRAMAISIAELAGVDLQGERPDFRPAYRLLPYFAECQARAMDFESAREVLKSKKLDPNEAILRIRELTPGK